MIYRMRIYDTVRENLSVFHEFFLSYLYPIQLRHGARLVGRWEIEDGRVVAVWEYDSRVAYEQIDAAVRADPGSAAAAQRRAELPPIIETTEEVFMTSTIQSRKLADHGHWLRWPTMRAASCRVEGPAAACGRG